MEKSSRKKKTKVDKSKKTVNKSTKSVKKRKGSKKGGDKTRIEVNTTVSPDIAWQYEVGAKKLVKDNSFGADACKAEFCSNRTPPPPQNACAGFYQNLAKNRNPAIPIADATRVKLQNPAGAYINAVKVTNPAEPNRTILIGQVPEKYELEIFWRMVFDENITSVFMAAGNVPMNAYIPVTVGAFSTIGKMFLNNKKVDTISKETGIFTIELLPEGCSNSLFVTIYCSPHWVFGKGPSIASDCTTICEKIGKQMDGIMFCSWNGVGRSGAMLMIYCIMSHIMKNVDVKISDLFSRLRGQKFGIVENPEQYYSIYQTVGGWIKQNSHDNELVKMVQ